VFETGVVPRAALPACGFLQISDPERFARSGRVPWFLLDRFTEVTDAYLRGLRQDPDGEAHALVDPLVVLERGARPQRPLPPFLATCGTWDHLRDDTRRLQAAVQRLGGRCEARYYENEPHAFQAFVVRASARRHWRDTFHFLDGLFAR
jgi:acetyl esterase/lipase